MAVLSVVQKTVEEQQAIDYIDDGREAIPAPPTTAGPAEPETRTYGHA